jgi:hypothetical protein
MDTNGSQGEKNGGIFSCRRKVAQGTLRKALRAKE